MTDLRELIPDDLHMTTAERLLLVADIIEKHPERHDQRGFCPDVDREVDLLGGAQVDECGTTYCVAGWAGVLVPPAEIDPGHIWHRSLHSEVDWAGVGAEVLGLEEDLARFIFFDTGNEDRGELVDLLREVAKVPEGERTIERCIDEGLLVRNIAHGDEVTFP